MRLIGLAIVLAVGLILAPLVGEAQQQPRKVPRVGVLSPFSSSFGPGPSFEAFRERHSVNWATSRGATLLLSIAGLTGGTIAFPASPPSWSVSRWTSSSQRGAPP